MKRIVVILVFLLAFDTVTAQSPAKSAYSPTGAGGLSSVISNVSLNSTFNAGTNAKAELKYTTKAWSTVGLSLDQKITEGTSVATPLDLLNGLTAGTKVGVNFQKMWWDPALSTDQFNYFDSAAGLFAARTGMDRRLVSENDIRKDGSDDEKQLLNKVATPHAPIFFNVQGYLEKTSYSYTTDSVTLTGITSSYVTPSASVSLMFPSVAPKSRFWIISYAYTENYTAADNVSLIQPFGTTKNLMSNSLSFGAPEKSYTHKIAIEYRKSFQFAGKFTLAIDPTVMSLSSKKIIEVLVPVYFIRGVDDQGKPTGVQGGFLLGYAGYSTAEKKFTAFNDGFGAQVFISAPFDLFKGL